MAVVTIAAAELEPGMLMVPVAAEEEPGCEAGKTLHRTQGPTRLPEPVMALLLSCPVVSCGSGN